MRLALASVLAGAATAAAAQEMPRTAAAGAPAVCPQGRISRIEVENGNVLAATPADASLVRWAAGLANRLHVRTRPSFIRGALLFAEGDCYDPYLAAESRNLLEAFGFFSRAEIVAEDDGANAKRVRVETRDEWTTRLDVGATYDAGLNLEKLNFVEDNLLGRGLVAHAEYRRRREVERTLVGVRVPNAFWRTEVGLYGGRTPDGGWVYQKLAHPFVGRVGRFSGLEVWQSTTSLFAYATDGAAPWAHVLAPVREDHLWLSGATRFGGPRGLWSVGALLTRDVFRPNPLEVSVRGYDERSPAPGLLPAAVARQIGPSAATRAALQLGAQRFRDVRRVGLDAVRDDQTVGLGYSVGVVVGKSLPVLVPAGMEPERDAYGRLGAHATFEAGPLLVHGGTTVEARRAAGEWRDLLAGGELAAYLGGDRLPAHTLFVRASGAGGWWTTIPFQITLGGREGVRSLTDDAFPGGRQLLFVAEDRIRLGWIPAGAVDVGATLFTDWGRVWAGDAPYGTSSGWRGAAGFGLRLAFPSGSRNVWRPDLVFPIGPGAGGSPILRVTMELNRLRAGFSTADLDRSRRFNIGP